MRQTLATLTFETAGQGFREITAEVNDWLRASGIRTGQVTLFCQHTSASLLITENAAPAVRRDLLRWLDAAAPEGGRYEHADEGPDDMPAHIKAALTQTSIGIPVVEGKATLGTWQGIYLFEHRVRPHRRDVVLHIIGEDR